MTHDNRASDKNKLAHAFKYRHGSYLTRDYIKWLIRRLRDAR